MENINKNLSDIPEKSGRLLIYFITVIASLLLLIAHKGIQQDWALFETPAVITVWYSCSIAVPFVISFLINDRLSTFPLFAGMVLLALIAALGWHTGNAYIPDLNLNAGTIFPPYVISLCIALFILLPLMQLVRDGRPESVYPRLYQLSWDNALTLLTAAVFTLACWLILWLWGGLFNVIGIDFFKTLFSETLFIYPVSGLFAGFGIGLGRSQIGAMRTALNVILAIARPLLPLISAVALLFLVTLAAQDLQPLWNTGHATTLLLCLMLGTSLLLNAVFQDGVQPIPYRRPTQWLTRAGLLSMPFFAAIAMYAVALRVAQYGWSVDRCYAALVTLFTSLYALGYAISSLLSLRSSNAWSGWTAAVNIVLALILTTVLLASQSPLLDFRALSVKDQLARAAQDAGHLDKLDLQYLRFELGAPGHQALLSLSKNETLDSAFRQRVDATLSSSDRFASLNGEMLQADIDAGHIRIFPDGLQLPEGLIESFRQPDNKNRGFIPPAHNCARKPMRCVLIGIDLGGDATLEWVFLDISQPWYRAPVFKREQQQWKLQGYMNMSNAADPESISRALDAGRLETRNPLIKDLWIGNMGYHFQPTP